MTDDCASENDRVELLSMKKDDIPMYMDLFHPKFLKLHVAVSKI